MPVPEALPRNAESPSRGRPKEIHPKSLFQSPLLPTVLRFQALHFGQGLFAQGNAILAATVEAGLRGLHRLRLPAQAPMRGIAGQLRQDMSPKAVPKRIEPARRGRTKDFHIAERPPDRAEPTKPGIPREIVRARQGHGRRWREPCPKAELCAWSDPRRCVIRLDRHADARGKSRVSRRKGQPQVSLAG